MVYILIPTHPIFSWTAYYIWCCGSTLSTSCRNWVTTAVVRTSFKQKNKFYQNQTITGSVARMLQRQVSLLCCLLSDMSSSDIFNHIYTFSTATIPTCYFTCTRLVLLLS